MKKTKIKQKVIKNAENVKRLIEWSIISRDEIREMMGLRKKKR